MFFEDKEIIVQEKMVKDAIKQEPFLFIKSGNEYKNIGTNHGNWYVSNTLFR